MHNPNVKWDDIIGLEAAKRTIKEAVVYPIKVIKITIYSNRIKLNIYYLQVSTTVYRNTLAVERSTVVWSARNR
jgi:hypothetical protein